MPIFADMSQMDADNMNPIQKYRFISGQLVPIFAGMAQMDADNMNPISKYISGQLVPIFAGMAQMDADNMNQIVQVYIWAACANICWYGTDGCRQY